ncbi:MAG: PspC domain-containing protein [Chitinophagaceae bacterium]|nr:PspC domain-containing protein [Chitinophagaceae bacterium]MCB9055103.1 PspC domain-containing protein [Chitinophagales bacterium]
MKKIININLSGRVIPIEDTAYEKLQAYIESLRRYFANEEGKDEIINDIESRIAELMNDKVKKGDTAITDDNIEEIINAMGRVEDFEAADTDTTEQAQPQPQSDQYQSETGKEKTKKQSRGRLYRDTNDRFIGGVCSGIADYTNVDPAIVRIIFAILGFATGIGILAYIILWMVLPPKGLEGHIGKRLYRNPDDKMIGGVAGGLAAYFNTSSRNVRLIFSAPILLNILIGILNGFRWHYDFDLFLNIGFGSITGTFILSYIILWVVLPEAESEYEKMVMRGETVDVNRIRQNVKEGMGNFKERVKTWSNDVRSSSSEFSTEVGTAAGRAGRGIGHAIGVLFKVFFLFIAGMIALGLFIAFIALLFGGIAWWPVNNFLWTSGWQQVLAWATLILFLIVPLMGFITWIVRRVARVKSKSNYLGWIFGGLWVLGWIAAILFASSIFRDFSVYKSTDTPITLTQPANGKLIVAVSEPELEYSGRFGWIDEGGNGWDLTEDTLKLSAVKFKVRASPDDQYSATIWRFSCGRNEQDAKSRANAIQFGVTNRDSILDVQNGYAISKENKFRGQNIEIEIRVPIGKKIRFDESVNRKLNAVNVKVKREYRRNRIVSIGFDDNERNFNYRTGIDYVMGANGELLSTEPGAPVPPPPPAPGEEYRYNPDNGPQENLDKQIQEKEKELERLKEQKNKTSASLNKIIKEKRVVNTQAVAVLPSPVSSALYL